MSLKNLYITSIAVILSIGVFGQNFQGKISAKMQAISVPEEIKGMEGMINQDMTFYNKNEKNRIELKKIEMTSVFINETIKKKKIILLDMMGEKTAIKQKREEKSSRNDFEF